MQDFAIVDVPACVIISYLVFLESLYGIFQSLPSRRNLIRPGLSVGEKEFMRL